MRKISVLILSLMIIFVFTAIPQAHAEGTFGDYMADIGAKAGRGVVNIVTSPGEVPCHISKKMHAYENKYTGFGAGLGKGFLKFGHRLLGGVMDIVTFVIPAEPLMESVCADYEDYLMELRKQ